MVKEEIKNYLKGEISDQMNKLIEESLKDVSDQVSNVVQENLNAKIDHLKSIVKRSITMAGLIGLGLLFLFLGFVDYIPRILRLSEGAAFVLIGVILIVIALIYRAGSKA
jgi:hypothetical protein